MGIWNGWTVEEIRNQEFDGTLRGCIAVVRSLHCYEGPRMKNSGL